MLLLVDHALPIEAQIQAFKAALWQLEPKKDW